MNRIGNIVLGGFAVLLLWLIFIAAVAATHAAWTEMFGGCRCPAFLPC